MLTAVIAALIYVCILVLAVYLIVYISVLAVYLIVWVLEQIGIALPPQVMKIIWVIIVLILILMLVTKVLPSAGIHLGSDQAPQLQMVLKLA